MRIAYIVAGHKNPKQFARMVSRLDFSNNVLYLHMYKPEYRRPYEEEISRLSLSCQFQWLKSINTYWASFGLQELVLTAFRKILADPIRCDYVSLISGQDYPIKSNTYITNFLKENCGKNFICSFSLPAAHWAEGGLDRIERYHFNVHGHWFHFPAYSDSWMKELARGISPKKRNIPASLIPFGGSTWWTLHFDAVQYICEYLQQHPEVKNFYRYTFAPDELMFPTILANSPFRDSVQQDNLRYSVWKEPAYHPEFLTAMDLPGITATNAFYARKFDVEVDSEIMDLIDMNLLSNNI